MYYLFAFCVANKRIVLGPFYARINKWITDGSINSQLENTRQPICVYYLSAVVKLLL